MDLRIIEVPAKSILGAMKEEMMKADRNYSTWVGNLWKLSWRGDIKVDIVKINQSSKFGKMTG